MDIDASNIQDKITLSKLYDSYLADNRNKLKIFDSLKKDIQIIKSRLGLNQRQSIQTSNDNTMSNNSKNKVLNISQDVKPFNIKNSGQTISFGYQGSEGEGDIPIIRIIHIFLECQIKDKEMKIIDMNIMIIK